MNDLSPIFTNDSCISHYCLYHIMKTSASWKCCFSDYYIISSLLLPFLKFSPHKLYFPFKSILISLLHSVSGQATWCGMGSLWTMDWKEHNHVRWYQKKFHHESSDWIEGNTACQIEMFNFWIGTSLKVSACQECEKYKKILIL